MVKTCVVCKKRKRGVAFRGRPGSKDGLERWCKECGKDPKQQAAIKEARRKAGLERTKKYQEAHPDRYKASYTRNNRRRGAKYAADYYERNKEKKRAEGRVRAAQRKAKLLKAVPPWADTRTIREIYDAADWMTRETGVEHHVDHIVPLVSKLVCGFHCEANLEIIPGRKNRQKGNLWWPDMPTE